MIIVCQKCSSRLQIDETKISKSQFTVRCPKCNSSIEAGPSHATTEQSAVSVGGSPATSNTRYEHQKAAPLFELETTNDTSPAASKNDQLLELLSGLVTQSSGVVAPPQGARPSWNPRKALVCVPEENREPIARALAETGYQVFVAEDTRQAVERMRENPLDVVVLDARFDPVEQGSAFVTREVNVLRPTQRRRLFFVLMSPTLRTMDAHAAFLNNVNAVLNVADIPDLPKLVEHRMRAFNEFYKDFNTAMRLPAI